MFFGSDFVADIDDIFILADKHYEDAHYKSAHQPHLPLLPLW